MIRNFKSVDSIQPVYLLAYQRAPKKQVYCCSLFTIVFNNTVKQRFSARLSHLSICNNMTKK